MLEEMNALHKNCTQELIQLPKGKKTGNCKWVFTVKFHFDGTRDINKVRVVTNKYAQTCEIEYKEIFAPSVQVILSIFVNLD